MSYKFCSWIIVLVLFLQAETLFGQKEFKVGKLTIDDLSLQSCPIDSSAGAFYITNLGKTGVAERYDTYDIVFKHLVRLKIVDKSELSRANVSIPFATGTTVSDLKGYTYNVSDGVLEVTKLGKENRFKEEVNDEYSKLKLSFPNVKEGSVIEYTYEVEYGNFYRLNTWFFQKSIPVLHSEYHVSLPEYFDYQRLMTGYVGLETADVKKELGSWGAGRNVHYNVHKYVAKNVPAFEAEPYSPAESDIISKIDFELRSLKIPGAIDKTYLPNTYGELAKNLMKSKYWNKDLRGASWGEEEISRLKQESEGGLELAENIYNSIKAFEKADESSTTLKVAFKKRTASDEEYNRLLIAMLREAGYDVLPVRISTRSHGKVNPFFPMQRHFNFTIAKLSLDGTDYLLDASEKNNEFGLLPQYCANGKGLVIHEGPEEWVELSPYINNGKTITAQMELDEEGYLSGDIKILRRGYTAQNFIEDLEDQGEEEYLEEFSTEHENWTINSHTIQRVNQVTNEESINTELEGKVEDLGSVLYLNPSVIDGLAKNPFKEETRMFPIEFQNPFNNTYSAQIEIPENFEVESVPDPLAIGLPGKAGSVHYSVSTLGNVIVISRRFKLSKTEYEITDFPILKEFYAQLIEKNGELIVIKRK